MPPTRPSPVSRSAKIGGSSLASRFAVTAPAAAPTKACAGRLGIQTSSWAPYDGTLTSTMRVAGPRVHQGHRPALHGALQRVGVAGGLLRRRERCPRVPLGPARVARP